MGWITDTLPNGKTHTYWLPDTLPENNDRWRNTQCSKKYLDDENKIRLHPGWLYSNGALTCDEYFYRNYEWKTVIDERPEDADQDGNKYIIKECPISEWETINDYTVRKTYKKYRFIVENKPEWTYDTEIVSHRVCDDESMSAYDVYTRISISDEELEKTRNNILKKIRAIRNVLLEKTDYLVLISKEKNKTLSSDFLNYRQNLRDITNQVDLSQMSEDTVREFLSMDEKYAYENVDGPVLNYFPQIPDNIFSDLE